MKFFTVPCLFILAFLTNAQADLRDFDYYQNSGPLVGADEAVLKEALFKDIKTHKTFSYKEARQILFGNLHLKESGKSYVVTDAYCEKRYDKSYGVGPGLIPDHRYLNCEHTWPQSRFNPQMSKAVQKTDLHHLYPTDSRANSSRGNILFGEVNGGPVSGSCTASNRGTDIYSGKTAFEPPKNHKGNVARALFYFSIRYKISIDDGEERHLREWNKEDPVDAEELARNEKIYELQGNRNPFIDDEHLAEEISNF